MTKTVFQIQYQAAYLKTKQKLKPNIQYFQLDKMTIIDYMKQNYTDILNVLCNQFSDIFRNDVYVSTFTCSCLYFPFAFSIAQLIHSTKTILLQICQVTLK